MSKTNVAIDLAMFVVTVAFAAWQGWDAKDLIWGLWIASLTLGYSFILASALSMFFQDEIRPANPFAKDEPPKKRIKDNSPLAYHLIIVLLTLFALGFGSPFTWLVLLLSAIFIAVSLMLKNDNAGVLQKVVWRVVTYGPMVAFSIVFFSIHFGGFHFVQGVFLNQFFPLIPESPFDNNFEGFFFKYGRRLSRGGKGVLAVCRLQRRCQSG